MGKLIVKHLCLLLIPACMFTAFFVMPCLAQTMPRSTDYAMVQKRLAQGWNTWDNQSVLTQVLLPQGLSVSLGIFDDPGLHEPNPYLENALIGRQGENVEKVLPGPHAYDGSYSDLMLVFHGDRLRVQTATIGNDLVMLVSPLQIPGLPPSAVFRAGMLWNRPGKVYISGQQITAELPDSQTTIYPVTSLEKNIGELPQGPFLVERLDTSTGISTGRRRSLKQVEEIIDAQRNRYESGVERYGKNSDIVDAIQTVLAWDTIYDPTHDRVITPVSRIWNEQWGGYVLFDWDTFFAADMAGFNNRDLAYANTIEILREETSSGFVPNYARAGNRRSDDRSEPPVGSMVVLDLYHHYHDQWFLRDTFPALLRWNRWWAQHRDCDGYLVWGSDSFSALWARSDLSIHTLQGARFESGLDNSPMYDNSAFDPKRDQMELADVGLMSMYIYDCDALAEIASALGKTADAQELKQRAAKYSVKLQTLWSPADHIFLNKDLHTNTFSYRLSPTNFYPMLAGVATAQQARQMVQLHLLNPNEFWGRWVIPSIARDDPAFKDQDYWRGRIWGPMNFLVYRGLLNYPIPKVQFAFMRKSVDLFLREWQKNRHVHENYNAVTGEGDDVSNSDRFYHWGALLAYLQIMHTTSQNLPGWGSIRPLPAIDLKNRATVRRP